MTEEKTPVVLPKITLREYAAVAAMQGLLHMNAGKTIWFENLAEIAVNAADALLAKLGEERKP